jgi:hypothetical protein
MSNLKEPKMSLEDFDAHLDGVIKDYQGSIDHVIYAVGAYFVGRHLGWKVIRLVSSRASYARHQRVLGLDFKNELPERGKYAHKSLGLHISDKLDSFWNVVKGKETIDADKKKLLQDF